MPFRAFVALPLPREDAFDAAVERLVATGADVKTTDSALLHMTLAFLGEVPEPSAPRLSEALDAALRGVQAFDVELQGVGAFPNDRAPRVIWLGARACAPLDALARAVRRACGAAGHPDDGKPFRAHVTLGRVRSERGLAALRQFLVANRDTPLPPLRASEVILYRSTQGAGGAHHEALHRARLEA